MGIRRLALKLGVATGVLLSANMVMAATISLRVVETTDIHANAMDYDYYKDRPTEQIGLDWYEQPL